MYARPSVRLYVPPPALQRRTDGQTDGRMDGWMDVQISPEFYRTSSPPVPSGAAAQKRQKRG